MMENHPADNNQFKQEADNPTATIERHMEYDPAIPVYKIQLAEDCDLFTGLGEAVYHAICDMNKCLDDKVFLEYGHLNLRISKCGLEQIHLYPQFVMSLTNVNCFYKKFNRMAFEHDMPFIALIWHRFTEDDTYVDQYINFDMVSEKLFKGDSKDSGESNHKSYVEFINAVQWAVDAIMKSDNECAHIRSKSDDGDLFTALLTREPNEDNVYLLQCSSDTDALINEFRNEFNQFIDKLRKEKSISLGYIS